MSVGNFINQIGSEGVPHMMMMIYGVGETMTLYYNSMHITSQILCLFRSAALPAQLTGMGSHFYLRAVVGLCNALGLLLLCRGTRMSRLLGLQFRSLSAGDIRGGLERGPGMECSCRWMLISASRTQTK
ncbi:hypothetical protein EDB19DRAFT_931801 [Suillus lakei]|nr:hypothetical protein EDB19DRAFT_931801 [Suillus lakei]